MKHAAPTITTLIALLVPALSIAPGLTHAGEKAVGANQSTRPRRAGPDWWALQPILRPDVPRVRNRGWGRNAIDAFVFARLEENGLRPSPAADQRTLVRRLGHDLVGLPSDPAAVREFVDDSSPDAWDRLVDRLLGSIHHGERRARHWLDVVRFGESNGFEYNQPRNTFWRYRNWVIDALNRDLAYDEFVRWQLAGDVLAPNSAEAIIATGFLVAGPHNTTLPANDRMRRTMRQDEMEDMVATVGQTFLGLTVHCGRCHDHKFDPITQAEYYRFVSCLCGVTHGEREIPDETTRQRRQRVAGLEETCARLVLARRAIEDPVRTTIVAARRRGNRLPPTHELSRPVARWDFRRSLRDQIGTLHCHLVGGARRDDSGLVLDGTAGHGVTAPIAADLHEKTLEAWVRLDRLDQRGGGVIGVQTPDGARFDSIVFGEQEPGRWMAGSDNFRRTQSFHGPEERDATSRAVHVAIVYDADGTITGYRNGRPLGEPYRSNGPQRFVAGKAVVLFGLRHSPADGNRFLAGTVVRARLHDRVLGPRAVAAAAAGDDFVSIEEIIGHLDDDSRRRHGELGTRISATRSEIKHLRGLEPARAYCMVPGKAGATRVLQRGEVTTPGKTVAPGGIEALPGLDADFGLAPDAPEGDRRVALARWITDPDNPLPARVIVNRLWHHHFGQGLVATPNDFGFNGGRCSHPRLLDWLAAEIRARNWSLKAIQRLILTSSTYRQSSRNRRDAARRDADNRLLWRGPRRRLEAEEIRDAMLAVSGELDLALGGPGYRDVREYKFRGSHFYDPIEQSGPEFRRRTIYRFTPRGARRTMLDTFDCPDPSANTPVRAVTTTPLQTLTLLNSAFVLRMADRLAVRLERDASPGGTDELRVRRVYELAHGRPAREDELDLARAFIAEHGLPAYCRVILNSNEFLHIR